MVRGSVQPGEEAEFESATPTSVGDGFDNETTKPQATNAAVSRERVIHLSTRCATEAEFVERFAAFTTNKVLTMPGRVDLPPDATARFVIALASRQPVLEGRCRVLAPPGGTPDNKVRLEFVEMGARSLAVHAKLMRAASAPKAKSVQAPPALPPRALPPLTARAAAASKILAPAPNIPAPAPSPSHLPVATATVPAPCERVPGAEYQLPANPFGKVETEALESFVECTIFEEEGSPPPRTEISNDGPTAVGRIKVPKGDKEDVIGDWAEGQETPVARIPKNLAQQAAEIIDELPAKHTERATAKFSNDLLASALAEGLTTSRPHTIAATEPPFAAALPSMAMPADPTDLIATQQSSYARQRAKRLPIFTFGAGLLLGAIAGFVLRGEKMEPVEHVATGVGSNTAAPTATPKPPPAAPESIPVAEMAVPAKDLRIPPPPPGQCLVEIATKPAGAVVRWNNKILGTSPLVGNSVPCGPGKVSLHKAKFRLVTLDVNVVPDATFRIEQDLRAPLVRLQITSVPPGGILQVNRRKMGTTPRTLFVPMKVATMVRVMRPGHVPWMRKVVPTAASTEVHATLVPLAKVPGTGALKPAAQTPAASKTAVAPAKLAAVAPKIPLVAPKAAAIKR